MEPLSSPQPEFEHDGLTFSNCLLLHRLLATGQEEVVLRRRKELPSQQKPASTSFLSSFCKAPEACPTSPLLSHTCEYKKNNSSDNIVSVLLPYSLVLLIFSQVKQVTALHLAARFTSASVVRVIVEAGADVRAVDKDYMQTPLHIAAKFNPNADVIRALVEGGAVVDARADYNDYRWKQLTPLHFAARHNPSIAVIRALVDKGADIDARDDRQWTPLHMAASSNPGKVKILIEKGANVNVLDRGQKSPLFYAAWNNNREAVIELCKAGANPHMGKNPLEDKDVKDEMKQLIREKLSL